MSDHFDDDPRDETLARGLSALAPSEFDLDADRTLGSMRPALQRARTRRRLAVSTSVLGVLVVLGAGAVVVQDQSESHVNIQGPTQTSVSTPSKTSTSVHPRVTTSTTSGPHDTTPTTTPADHTSTTRSSGGVTGGTPGTTPRSTPASGSTPDGHGGGNSGGGNNQTTTTVAAPSTETYTSAGGRATVRFANGKLTLVSYTAAAGYTPEVHTNTADDVEVRFSNDTTEWRIRVRVQDGRVESEIKEN